MLLPENELYFALALRDFDAPEDRIRFCNLRFGAL